MTIKAIVALACTVLQEKLDHSLLDVVVQTQAIDRDRPNTFPTVNAVNVEEKPEGLVNWLIRVWKKELFPENHLIPHHELITDKTKITNH